MSGVRSELHYLSLTEVAAKIRATEVSPVEVTASTLERVRLINPRLSAYYAIFEAQAMKDATEAERQMVKGDYRGPLHGVPIGIKDVVASGPTTGGSDLRREYIADHDAAVVRRLKSSGAIIVGKLATSEFGLGGPSSRGTLSPAAQSMVNGPHPRWFQLWTGSCGGGRNGVWRRGYRYRRLDPDAGQPVRRGWAQAELR